MMDNKFRAWDKGRKEYHDPHDVALTGTGLLSTYCDEADEWDQKRPGYYDIEQYTGRKDKDNKDIYDSDRLDGGGPVTGIVYWNEDEAQWWISPESTAPNVPLRQMYCESVAVVGTIHDKDGQKLPRLKETP